MIVGLTGGPSSSDSSTPATGQLVVGATLSVLGLVGEVVLLVRLFRSKQWRAAWRSPLRVLTRRQRKDLVAQVRGRTAADPARLLLARHLAERLAQQRQLAILYPALLALCAGQTVLFPDAFHLTLAGWFAVLAVVGTPLTLRDGQRAERFLEQHPAPPPGGAGV